MDKHTLYTDDSTVLESHVATNLVPRAEKILLEACEKYDEAIKLNPNYSNAYNSWALALSTYAKTTEDEALFGIDQIF